MVKSIVIKETAIKTTICQASCLLKVVLMYCDRTSLSINDLVNYISEMLYCYTGGSNPYNTI